MGAFLFSGQTNAPLKQISPILGKSVWTILGTNWIGVAFVSEEVPNREQVEDQLAERTEALRQEAQTALDAWLNEQGLEQVMGVIIPKKTI